MTWSETLPLAGAGGEPVDLWRTIVSHGVADLPPNRIDEDARTLETTIALPRGRPRTVLVQEAPDGHAMLTGRGTQSDVDATLAAGFAVHLTKPTDINRLLQAVALVAANQPRRSDDVRTFEDDDA